MHLQQFPHFKIRCNVVGALCLWVQRARHLDRELSREGGRRTDRQQAPEFPFLADQASAHDFRPARSPLPAVRLGILQTQGRAFLIQRSQPELKWLE